MIDFAEQPRQPFSESALIEFYNRGPRGAFDALVDRVLESLSPTERARARDHFLQRARALAPAETPYRQARAFRARMVVLVGAFPGWLDTGMVDGLLAAALLVTSRKVPCEKTILRALDQ